MANNRCANRSQRSCIEVFLGLNIVVMQFLEVYYFAQWLGHEHFCYNINHVIPCFFLVLFALALLLYL